MPRRGDETEDRLLSLLRADARRPVASLARELNLSRTAIQDRIARMERDGVIEGYTVLEGSDALDHAALAFVVIETRPCDPVLRRLKAVFGVERVFSIAGDIDALVLVRANSATEISRIGDRLSSVDGVGSIRLQTVLHER